MLLLFALVCLAISFGGGTTSFASSAAAAAAAFASENKLTAGRCTFESASSITNSSHSSNNSSNGVAGLLPCQVALFSKPSFTIEGLIKIDLILQQYDAIQSCDQGPSTSGRGNYSNNKNNAVSNDEHISSHNNSRSSSSSGILLSTDPASSAQAFMIKVSDFCSAIDNDNDTIGIDVGGETSNDLGKYSKDSKDMVEDKVEVDKACENRSSAGFFQLIYFKIITFLGRSNNTCPPVVFSGSYSSINRSYNSSNNDRSSSSSSSSNLLAARYRSKGVAVAYALRGNCSFDVKAAVATQLGYSALIVETIDDAIFPAGSINETFKASIPILMIPGGSIASKVKSMLEDNEFAYFRSFSETTTNTNTNTNTLDNNDNSKSITSSLPSSDNVCSSNKSNARKTTTIVSSIYLPIKLIKLSPAAVIKHTTLTDVTFPWSSKLLLWPFNKCTSSYCVSWALKAAFLLIIAILLICSTCFKLSSRGNESRSGWGFNRYQNIGVHVVFFVIFSSVMALFIFTRIATLRIKSIESSGGGGSGGGGEGGGGGADDSVLSLMSSLSPTYHHSETDEVIFQTLVENVKSVGWFARGVEGGGIGLGGGGYRLNASMIKQYNLSPENYSPYIFIHPPMFVFSAAIFNCYFDLYSNKFLSLFGLDLTQLGLPSLVVSLPIVPLLFHIGTFIAISVVVFYIFTEEELISTSKLSFSYSFSLLVVVVCMMCPLMAFCSSKFWIDNCLLFSCTFSAAILLYLVRPSLSSSTSSIHPQHSSSTHTYSSSFSSSSSSSSSPPPVALFNSQADIKVVVEYRLRRHFIAGVFFSVSCLNTKITGLAMLPCLLAWIFSYRASLYYPITNHIIVSKESSVRDYRRAFIIDLTYHISTFLLASIACYLPWLYAYYTATGRLLPNSWPSESMVKNSLFLQQAINRPFYFYFERLMTLSPAIFIGLCVALSILKSFLVAFVSIAYNRFFHSEPFRVHNKELRYYSSSGSGSGSNSSSSNNNSNNGSSKTYYTFFDNIVVFLISNKLKLHLAILSIWAVSFIIPFTILGALGSGYQTRFILPAIPPLAVLTVFFVVQPYLKCQAYLLLNHKKNNYDYPLTSNKMLLSKASYIDISGVLLRFTIIAVFIGYSAMHAFYYSVLYPNMFADIEHSIIDIIVSVLDNVYYAPTDKYAFDSTIKFMKHFGLNR